MTKFRVWAPGKDQVELVLPSGRHAMHAEFRGWWSVQVDAPKEVDYAFSLDGGPPRPDPRSPRLPNGVHAAGRTVDHRAFAWRHDGFRAPPLSSALIYELHVGTFSKEGTFDGVARHLDHLLSLGVTHVELMPVHSFPGTHGWGYDGVGLFAPHEPYGGPDGLARLVDTCHGAGLAVLVDVVYNHLGPEGNYLWDFGPYFSKQHRTPWGEAVNLDGRGAAEVRRLFIDAALSWLRDYRADGLRIDAIEALFDTSAVHFLEELSTEVDALQAHLGRPLQLIAESGLNDPRVVRPREAGGYGIDAQWSDDFHHALHSVLTGEQSGYYSDFGRMSDLAKALGSAFVYDGNRSKFRERRHGRSTAGLSGHRFLGYTQTHDQVGNRAEGDRLCHIVSPARAKIAAAVMFTSPFVPMIFAGEEWAASSPFAFFADFMDPALHDAVREGRRAEFAAFGWAPEDIPDPMSRDTFLAAKLAWDEAAVGVHAEMLEWYRRLAALRRSTPSLTNGRLEEVDVRFAESERWLRYSRGAITVVFNVGPNEISTVLKNGELLLESGGVELTKDRMTVPPDAIGIVREGGR